MRSKKVIRHYCDFCSKGLFSRPGMVSHEATCIKNPKRGCYLCQDIGFKPKPIGELIEALDDSFEALRNKAEGCPACILAAIVQTKKERDGDDWIDFDYKKAKAEWQEENRYNRIL